MQAKRWKISTKSASTAATKANRTAPSTQPATSSRLDAQRTASAPVRAQGFAFRTAAGRQAKRQRTPQATGGKGANAPAGGWDNSKSGRALAPAKNHRLAVVYRPAATVWKPRRERFPLPQVAFPTTAVWFFRLLCRLLPRLLVCSVTTAHSSLNYRDRILIRCKSGAAHVLCPGEGRRT